MRYARVRTTITSAGRTEVRYRVVPLAVDRSRCVVVRRTPELAARPRLPMMLPSYFDGEFMRWLDAARKAVRS